MKINAAQLAIDLKYEGLVLCASTDAGARKGCFSQKGQLFYVWVKRAY